MKKFLLFIPAVLLLNGCAMLAELTALTKCEFSFHSAQDPTVCNIQMAYKNAWSDFTFVEGQTIAAHILKGTLPFEITANVEVRNPGAVTAAVNSIEWIAFIDEVQVAQGRVANRVEIPPGGGTSLVPVRIRTDLFDYLEGDKPRTMINFALNLVDASNQPTRLSMKIKPSVVVGAQTLYYPGYFTITKEFKSGN
jgi:hypothetical protein